MGGRRLGPGRRPLERGSTLLDVVFVMAITGILAAASVPRLTRGLDRARALGAARYLAHQCGFARFHAVGKGRNVALQFTDLDGDFASQLFADGNRNGVRSVDIAAAVDTALTSRETLSANFPGVRIALDPALGLGSDPVRLGGSTLLSFSPAGTATAGTVYVLGRDGTQLAVRVLGVTGRTRVLRYEPSSGTWEQP